MPAPPVSSTMGHMKVWDYALLVAVAAYALVRLPDWEIRKPEIAHADALVEKFEHTIFHSEFGAQRARVGRWDRDVVIGISGKKSAIYVPYLEEVADHVCRLTGRNVRVMDLGQDFDISTVLQETSFPVPPHPNFFVFLTSHENLGKTMSFIPGAADDIKSKRAMGYGTGGGLDDAMAMAFVGVSDNFAESKVRNTLLEEITQGFGPVNDTEIVQPSIWSDNGPDLDRLPLNDQIILRALYDPAIHPGMPKEVALAVVRKVIPALVKAVKRHGEKTLYQRDGCN